MKFAILLTKTILFFTIIINNVEKKIEIRSKKNFKFKYNLINNVYIKE